MALNSLQPAPQRSTATSEMQQAGVAPAAAPAAEESSEPGGAAKHDDHTTQRVVTDRASASTRFEKLIASEVQHAVAPVNPSPLAAPNHEAAAAVPGPRYSEPAPPDAAAGAEGPAASAPLSANNTAAATAAAPRTSRGDSVRNTRDTSTSEVALAGAVAAALPPATAQALGGGAVAAGGTGATVASVPVAVAAAPAVGTAPAMAPLGTGGGGGFPSREQQQAGMAQMQVHSINELDPRREKRLDPRERTRQWVESLELLPELEAKIRNAHMKDLQPGAGVNNVQKATAAGARDAPPAAQRQGLFAKCFGCFGGHNNVVQQ